MCPLPGSARGGEGGGGGRLPGQQCVRWWRQVKVRWTVRLLNNARREIVSQTTTLRFLLQLTGQTLCFLSKFVRWLDDFSPALSLAFSLFHFPPPTPCSLDFMNLLNWRWRGACGTLCYWFAVGFSVVGNTSQSLGWTHEAFYLQSLSTGKPAFSMDFFIMSLWKANAFTT